MDELVATEGSTARYTGTFTDEAGIGIDVGILSTFTVTLTNADTGAVINNRSNQDILNANGVTIDSNGNMVWTLSPADNPIINDAISIERHIARFTWTWGDKVGNKNVVISVENLVVVP